MGKAEVNPKDTIGSTKLPMSVVPANVLAEVALGMLEGALKYGRHNWRDAGIRYSIYYDATQRHLMAWWEGEDIDAASRLSHITKAICSLLVLRDGMLTGLADDDRPTRIQDVDLHWDEYANRAREMVEAAGGVHQWAREAPKAEHRDTIACTCGVSQSLHPSQHDSDCPRFGLFDGEAR